MIEELRGFWGRKRLLAMAVGLVVSGGAMFRPSPASAADGGADATKASAVQTPSAVAPQTDQAKAATTALQKEYSAHENAPNNTPLRTQSDYFSTNPSPDITEEAIVTALGQSLGSDARADMYIKWQLLSAVPGRFSDKNAPRVLRYFQEHATLTPRPGATAASKEELIQAIRGKTAAVAGSINQDMTTAVNKAVAENVVPLKYLDDLFAKLPSSDAVLKAGFAEAYNRAETGIDSDLSDKVIAATRSWVSTSPTAPQMTTVRAAIHDLLQMMGGPAAARRNADANSDGGESNLASAVDMAAHCPTVAVELVDYSDVARPTVAARKATPVNTNSTANKNDANNVNNTAQKVTDTFPPQYFTSVSWNPTQKRLLWSMQTVKFTTKKQLGDLEKFLDNAIANPNGGVKFQGPK